MWYSDAPPQGGVSCILSWPGSQLLTVKIETYKRNSIYSVEKFVNVLQYSNKTKAKMINKLDTVEHVLFYNNNYYCSKTKYYNNKEISLNMLNSFDNKVGKIAEK